MPADLLLYALVAAGLVFWLRNVLGTRHGEERERPNPFLGSEETDISKDAAQESFSQYDGLEQKIIDLAAEPRKNYILESKEAEAGLLDISRMDRNFDIDFFLDGAQDAFAIVVEAFADGDRDTLKPLLSDQVYAAFEGAIKTREESGEKQETEIHAIRSAEIIEARLDGKNAFVTVKFEAEESSVTRDKDGEVIAGTTERTTDMRDIWTFTRNLKSRDPVWIVTETRGDFEGDNDLIPDTH